VSCGGSLRATRRDGADRGLRVRAAAKQNGPDGLDEQERNQMSEYRPAPPTAAAGLPQEPVRGGAWYYVVAIASAGVLAAIPFWHATTRLGRPEVRKLAVAYTLADVFLVVLAVLNPRQPDGTSTNEALRTILGVSALVVIVAACVQLRGLRRKVYGGGGAVPVHRDPVVARALEARDRREETRQLIAREPGLRQELGVGRPDLGRGYDDGGLGDVNTASADLLARVCDMDLRDAERVVEARALRGGRFFSMGEVFLDVALPLGAEEELRERGIAL